MQIRKGYINAIVALFSLVVDCALLIMGILLGVDMIQTLGLNCVFNPVLTIEATIVCLAIGARVIHLPIFLFYLLCCAPCYFCDDSCCIKKWLTGE